MNAAFVVQGSLFLAGAVFAVRASHGRRARPFVVLAGLNAVGNVVVASVPSGPSGTPWLHVTGATLAIVGGNAAIVTGARLVAPSLRRASVGIGVIGLLSFVALAVDSTTGAPILLPAAVWERLSVYTITGWELVVALGVLSRVRRGKTLHE